MPAYILVWVLKWTTGSRSELNCFQLVHMFDVFSILWDLIDQTPKTEFVGHKSDVSSFAFSPDFRLFVTGGGDCVPRLWDLRLGQTVRMFTDLESPKQDINDVAVSVSSNYPYCSQVWSLMKKSLNRYSILVLLPRCCWTYLLIDNANFYACRLTTSLPESANRLVVWYIVNLHSVTFLRNGNSGITLTIGKPKGHSFESSQELFFGNWFPQINFWSILFMLAKCPWTYWRYLFRCWWFFLHLRACLPLVFDFSPFTLAISKDIAIGYWAFFPLWYGTYCKCSSNCCSLCSLTLGPILLCIIMQLYCY